MVLRSFFTYLLCIVGWLNPRQLRADVMIKLLPDASRLGFTLSLRDVVFAHQRPCYDIVRSRIGWGLAIAFLLYSASFLLELHESLIYSLRIIDVGIFVVGRIDLVSFHTGIFSVLVVTHLDKIFLGSDVLAAYIPVSFLLAGSSMFLLLSFTTLSRVGCAVGS